MGGAASTPATNQENFQAVLTTASNMDAASIDLVKEMSKEDKQKMLALATNSSCHQT